MGDSWGTRPWFGDAPEDLALGQLLYSIRYNAANTASRDGKLELADAILATLPVTPGRYRVSLLLCENYHAREPFRDRSINIDMEGHPCARDLRILAVQGIAGYPVPPTQAIVLTCEVDVEDDALDVLLFSQAVEKGVDANVILNGLVVERMR